MSIKEGRGSLLDVLLSASSNDPRPSYGTQTVTGTGLAPSTLP
jgi:hypothetical protein